MSRFWSNAPSLTNAYPSSPGHVFGSATSRAGAERIKHKSESLEEFVLSVLRVAGDRGATDFELQDAAAREGITSLLRPRRATLLARGDIVPSGRKRPSPTGIPVMVWTVRP
jgi:hypothetical protein